LSVEPFLPFGFKGFIFINDYFKLSFIRIVWA
jgi:hypothetical protein